MTNASTLENMSPQLVKVVERAQREPEGRFIPSDPSASGTSRSAGCWTPRRPARRGAGWSRRCMS